MASNDTQPSAQPPPNSPKPRRRMARNSPDQLRLIQAISQEDFQGGGTSSLAARRSPVRRSSPVLTGLPFEATVSRKRPAPRAPLTRSPKKVKMVDQSTQTQTASGRDHTSALAPTQNQNLQPLSQLAPSGTSQIKSCIVEEMSHQLDDFIARCAPRPAPRELWGTPKYDDANDEERQKMLVDFIHDNLENEDFILMVEDLENSWLRIGLR